MMTSIGPSECMKASAASDELLEDFFEKAPFTGDSLPGFPSPDTFEYLALHLGCETGLVQSQKSVGRV